MLHARRHATCSGTLPNPKASHAPNAAEGATPWTPRSHAHLAVSITSVFPDPSETPSPLTPSPPSLLPEPASPSALICSAKRVRAAVYRSTSCALKSDSCFRTCLWTGRTASGRLYSECWCQHTECLNTGIWQGLRALKGRASWSHLGCRGLVLLGVVVVVQVLGRLVSGKAERVQHVQHCILCETAGTACWTAMQGIGVASMYACTPSNKPCTHRATAAVSFHSDPFQTQLSPAPRSPSHTTSSLPAS